MVDIGQGFLIQVDPESLRAAAGRADRVSDDLAAAAFQAYGADAEAWQAQARGLGHRISALHSEVHGLAGSLRYGADVYEAAEAGWILDTQGRGSAEGAAALADLDRLAAQYAGSGADPIADGRLLRAEREGHALDDVLENLAAIPDLRWVISALFPSTAASGVAGALPPPGLLAAGAYTALVARGRGVVARGAKLGADPNPQEIAVEGERPRASAKGAPTGLAGAARRIPGGPDDLARVETYTFDDGHQEHAVYVQGTREMLQDGDWNVIPGPEEGHDTADMESNADIYLGEVESEAYRGVVQALEEAGVDPGEPVHAFGHSQGAMIIERIASEGDLQVDTAVSYATPQQALLDDTLHVNLAYTDDPVAALTGAGVPGPAGAAGSVVITDTFDPGPDPLAPMEPHLLENYLALAAEADASADPRLEGVRDVFAHLAEADSMRTSTWNASRVPRGDG